MTGLEGLLEDFGLSDTEVAVYRAVLESGEATAGEVADGTGVTQSYVYSVAETLAERDLVTIDDAASPTRFRARPPGEVAATLTDRVSALEREVESLYATRSRAPDGFSVLSSRRTVLDRVEETVADARSEVVLVVPAGVAADLRASVAAASERGVFTLVLLTETTERTTAPPMEATATRVWEESPPVFVIADGESGLMGEPGMLSGRHGDEETLAFANRTIADGFLGMALSNYWPMGHPVDETRPRPLPATYDCFRAGIFDAARRTRDGEKLVGTVTVRGDDGDRTFENAPIVEVRQGLVDPPTNEFPNENSVVFDTGEGRVAVGCPGGIGSFYEDYAGVSLRLEAA